MKTYFYFCCITACFLTIIMGIVYSRAKHYMTEFYLAPNFNKDKPIDKIKKLLIVWIASFVPVLNIGLIITSILDFDKLVRERIKEFDDNLISYVINPNST